ncbi:hypothetical protein AWB81_08209 [Caballeronia arationis]|nr:hypothetical protein AWB81_08209 [Caballeronia arationis]
MSCTLASPPGTCSTMRSMSVCVSAMSGSIAGVSAVHSGVIALGGTTMSGFGALPSSEAASALSTGVANRSRTLACKPMRRNRSTRVTASSEWPPREKKLSCLPTRSRPSNSAHRSASAASV